MKKISYLFVFVFAIVLANVCNAQDNAAKPKAKALDGANAVINGVTGGEASIVSLTENKITVDKAGYTVSSFVVTLTIGDDLISISNTGNKLSERQATLVRKKNAGKKVYIEDIVCKDADGNEFSLPAMTFIIK